MKKSLNQVFYCALFVLSGCAQNVCLVAQTSRVRQSARWALLPVANYSEAAQAGEKTEEFLDAALRRHGFNAIDRYPALKDDDAHLTMSERERFTESLEWARAQHYDYAVTGSVTEWRDKGTVEAEPVVGLTLSVLDLASRQTVFSASGARTGSQGDSESGVALRLLQDLTDRLSWVR